MPRIIDSAVLTSNDFSVFQADSNQNIIAMSDLTCFTCDRSKTNEICNINAVDEKCGKASSIELNGCMTTHQFNSVTRDTIYVEKKCVQECLPSMVGCTYLNEIHKSIRVRV
jgi:hypothetical protein